MKLLYSLTLPLITGLFAQSQNTSPYWSLAGNSNASTTTSKLGTTTNIPVRLFTNNLERMRLTEGGNVGIGTTAPEGKLHVWRGSAGTVTAYANAPLVVEGSTHNYINILAPEANETGIFFGKPSSAVSGGITYNNSALLNGLQFRTNGSVTRMVITNAGNLGIGTTAPTHKLHVFRGTAGAVTGYKDAGLVVEGSTHNYINVLAPEASETGIFFGKPSSAVSGGLIYNSASLPNGFQFRTNGSVTRMVITNAGNVGINTTTPIYPLDIYNTTYQGGMRVATSYGSWDDPIEAAHDRVGLYASSYGSYYREGKGIGVVAEGGSIGLGASGYIGVYGTGVIDPWHSGTTGVYGNGGYAGVEGFSSYTAYNDVIDHYGVRGEAYNPNEYLGENFYGIYGEAWGGEFNAAGYFTGDVWANSYKTLSDRKFKTGIAPLKNTLEQLMKLKPSAYEFKTGEFEKMNFPKGKQIGLIADEVKEVFPELVQSGIRPAQYDREKRKVESPAVQYEGVNYQGLIPVLIASLQEQQHQINEQKQQNEELMKRNEQLEKRLQKLEALIVNGNSQADLSLSSAYLEQNKPNPVGGTTVISYHVPESSGYAQLLITDIKGAVVKTIALSKGSGQVSINSNALAAGAYTYSLWIDKKLVESKKMVITR